MLTPIEIQSKSFKSGIGYDRKDVDAFMREVLASYEKQYKENVELKDKFTVLNERLQYYKSIEKTLQKALLLAEQTAEDTKQTAMRNAKVIEKEARGKADLIIADAKNELNHVNQMITRLTQQYESYKVQYKQLAKAQIELIQSPTFELTLMNGDTLNTSYTNPVDATNLGLNSNHSPDTEELFADKEEVNTTNRQASYTDELKNQTSSNVNNDNSVNNNSIVNELNHNSNNQKIIKKAPLGEEDLEYLKEHAKEFFQEESLESNDTMIRNTNNSNTDLGNGMEDFTVVEEAQAPVESIGESSGTSKDIIESDFDFMDFEVDLDD